MPPADFDAVYRAWHGPIRGWVYRVTTDLNLSQEVAADTFLKAWRAWDRLPADADTKAWLWRIARHVLYDRARRRYRQRHVTVHELEADWHVACPVDHMGAVERWTDFYKGWQCLTEHQRSALRLVALGYDSVEGSAELGLTDIGFRTLVWRGRHELEKQTR